jgi:5-methylcytosine-specific restriction protein A
MNKLWVNMSKSKQDTFYLLNDNNVDPQRLKKERERARKLKKSQWWINQINLGICYYCQRKFEPGSLTLDHVVPLARGGRSQAGNVVPACKPCNREKSLDTPVDQLLKQLKSSDSSET